MVQTIMGPFTLVLMYVISVVIFRADACAIVTEEPISPTDTRKLGAFNIRVFGPSKAGKDDVMAELVTILKRYDIVLIQEIRNKDGTAIVQLLNLLNADPDVNGAYAMEIGPRVGRTSSKEQYCYFYKSQLFDVIYSYTFDDLNDVFEREPFNVQFQDKLDSSKQFVLSGLHAKPDDAVAELDFMPVVYDDIVSKTGLSEVIMLGDFNADCNYVGFRDWSSISLYTESRFTWFIGNEEDTTVSSTDCAYDRFVVAGGNDTFVNAANVFNFEEEHDLSNEFALDVSDHYPVEIVIKYN